MRASEVWAGIDALAAHHGLSTAQLARHAGLDPGVFAPSRRQGLGEEIRWPMMGHLGAVCNALGLSLGDFLGFMYGEPGRRAGFSLPYLNLARASDEQNYDGDGYPVSEGWRRIDFPDVQDPNAFGILLQDDIYDPIYPNGTLLVIAPDDRVAVGHRVLVNHREDGLFIATLLRQTPFAVTLCVLTDDAAVEHPATNIAWLARIVWARQ